MSLKEGEIEHVPRYSMSDHSIHVRSDGQDYVLSLLYLNTLRNGRLFYTTLYKAETDYFTSS